MANFVPAFLSGSRLRITIDGKTVAFAQNLTFTDDVPSAPVGGIGSYSYSAIEPTQYMARGSFSLVRYETAASKENFRPRRAIANGNSMLGHPQFNPAMLATQGTFDIVVSDRMAPSNDSVTFTIKDCRLTDYALSFTPGALVIEQIGFVCIRVIDHSVQSG